MDEHTLAQRLAAEFLGTFVLVFGGCGAAVLAAGVPDVGIGWLGVALAFGLTVVTMAYAVGPRERRPLQPRRHPRARTRPAVPLGATRRPYVVTQVVAAIAAAAVLTWWPTASTGSTRRSPASPPTGTATAPRRLLAARRHRGRDRADRGLPLRHPRRHRHPRTQGLRADRDRPVADPDPPGQHPGQQHVGEPGPLHRPGPVRRRRRPRLSCGCSGWRHSSGARSPG